MKIISVLKKPYILLIISAVLSALPLTFSSLFLLSWISFVPLFYVIIKNSGDKLRYAIGRGFLFGFVYHMCIYYWFLWFFPLDYVNLSEGPSVIVVCLAWFGISAVHGVLWCIPFICCHFAKKLSSSPVFLSAVGLFGILAAEKAPQLSELSFPWVRVSLGQYKATPLIQSLSLFGVDGLDLIMLAISAIAVIALISKKKRRIIALSLAGGLFIVNLGFGVIRINQTPEGRPINILTVQGSVPKEEKWAHDGDVICYDIYSSLTKENITDDVDLVLWPESAVPKIYPSRNFLDQYSDLSAEIKKPILAGIIIREDGGNTNNAILVDKNGPITIYTKRQPVPFGEYMPYKDFLSKIFPVLTNLNIIEDDYIAGQSSKIMSVKDGKIGNIICFESIYPHLTRQSVLDGAELMVEVTNDAWLEDSPAMYQHLAHGVFRSVENGRYLIRSANSGISAVIDSYGNVKSQIGIEEKGALKDTAEFFYETTLYTKVGDCVFPLCFIALLIWTTIIFIKKRKASA